VGPDDGRPSRPVLRAAEAENPPADSPDVVAQVLATESARMNRWGAPTLARPSKSFTGPMPASGRLSSSG